LKAARVRNPGRFDFYRWRQVNEFSDVKLAHHANAD